MKASLRCWFCDVTAFTKSLIRLDRFSQPVFKARVQRTGFRVVRESDRREKHEAKEFCTLVFKQSDLAPPTGGCSNQCPCGAEPRPHSLACKVHII